MIRITILFLFILSLMACSSTKKVAEQEKKPTRIEWISIEEAEKRAKKEPKKILVDLYTSWCTYCVKMDLTTFRDTSVIAYISENFYPVKIDGESPKTFKFQGKEFNYVKKTNSRRGFNELAASLTDGLLKFPTIVFLDEEQKIIQALPGYKKPSAMNMILHYIEEDKYLNVQWQDYVKEYKAKNKL